MKEISLRKKLSSYSAIAATILSFENSEAQIIYHDVSPDLNIPSTGGFYLDLNNDGVDDFFFSGTSNWNYTCPGIAAGISPLDSNSILLSSSYGIALDFSFNVQPGSGTSFGWKQTGEQFFWLDCVYNSYNGGSCDCDHEGDMANAIDKYFGIRFHAADGEHYGWIRMKTEKTLADYAYQEPPGIPILTGEFDGCDTVFANIDPVSDIIHCGSGTETLTTDPGASFLVQWLRNGQAISGADLSLYLANQTGVYSAVVFSVGCADTSEEVSLTFQVEPEPIISRNGDTLFSNYANGNEWLLNTNPIPGANGDQLVITQSGTYALEVTDSVGCTSKVGEYFILCENLLDAEIYGSYWDTICSGNTSYVMVNWGCCSYQWLLDGLSVDGATSDILFVDMPGQYSVIVTSDIGCRDTTETWTLTVLDLPIPEITQNGDYLVSNYPSGNQWYLNGEKIDLATGPSYLPGEPGIYQLEVTDQFECTGISEPFDFYPTEISATIKESFIHAFFDGQSIVLELSFELRESKVVLFNAIGCLLVETSAANDITRIDGSKFAPGVYFIRITHSGKNYVRKVVIE